MQLDLNSVRFFISPRACEGDHTTVRMEDAERTHTLRTSHGLPIEIYSWEVPALIGLLKSFQAYVAAESAESG